jgi:hypothetical protein
MPSPGVLIFVAVLGAFLCAKARLAGAAIVFSLIAFVVLVATPLGQGIPDAAATFFSTLDGASTPVLNQSGGEQP